MNLVGRLRGQIESGHLAGDLSSAVAGQPLQRFGRASGQVHAPLAGYTLADDLSNAGMAEAKAGRPGSGRPSPVADPVEERVLGVRRPQLGHDLLLAFSRLVGDHSGVDHRTAESGGFERPAQARLQAIESSDHDFVDPFRRARHPLLTHFEAPQPFADDLLFEQPAAVMLRPQGVALRRADDPIAQLARQLATHSGAGKLQQRLAFQPAHHEFHRARARAVLHLSHRRRVLGRQRFVSDDDERRQRPQRASEARQQVERRTVAPLQVVDGENERPIAQYRPAQRQKLIEQRRTPRRLRGIRQPAGRRFAQHRGQTGIAPGLGEFGEDITKGAVRTVRRLVLDAVGGQREGPRLQRLNLSQE